MSSAAPVVKPRETAPSSWSYFLKTAKAGPHAVAAVADDIMPADFIEREAGGGAYTQTEQRRAERFAQAHELAASAIKGSKAEWTERAAVWLKATAAKGAPPSDENMLPLVALLLQSIVDVGAKGPNLVPTDDVPVDAATVAAKRRDLLAAAGDRAAAIATLKKHAKSSHLLLSLVLGELVWQAEKDELVSAFVSKLAERDSKIMIAKEKDKGKVPVVTAADAPEPAGGVFGALAKNVERIHGQSVAARTSAVTLQSGDALGTASQDLVAAVKEQVLGINLAIVVNLLNAVGVGAYGGASRSVRDLVSTGARQTLLRDWGVELSHVNTELEGPGGIKAGGVLDMVPADVRAVLDAGPPKDRDVRYQNWFHGMAAATSTSLGVVMSAVGTKVPMPTCGAASAADAHAFYALCDAATPGTPQEQAAVAAQLNHIIQAALVHTPTKYLSAWEADAGQLVAGLRTNDDGARDAFNAAVPAAVRVDTPAAALTALDDWVATAPAFVDASAKLVMSLLLSLKHTPRDASMRRLQMLCVNSAAAVASLQVLFAEKAATDAELADAYVTALGAEIAHRGGDPAVADEGAILLAATCRSLEEQSFETLMSRVMSLLDTSAITLTSYKRNDWWTKSPLHAAVRHSPSEWETAAADAFGAVPKFPALASLFAASFAKARVGGRLVRGRQLAWRRDHMAGLSATRREGGAPTTFSNNALEHKEAAMVEMESTSDASGVDDVLAAADFYGSGPRRALSALVSVVTSVPLSAFGLAWLQGDARVQGGTVYERVHARMDGDKDGIGVCGSQRADSQTNAFVTVAPGRKLTVGYDRRWSVQWLSGWGGVGAFDCPALRRAAEIIVTVNNGPQRRPGVYVAGDVFEKKEYEAAAVLGDVWTPSALRAFYVATSSACREVWEVALDHLKGDDRFDGTADDHVQRAMFTALDGVVASVALHADLRGWADGTVIGRARAAWRAGEGGGQADRDANLAAAWRAGGCAPAADTDEGRVADLTVAQSFLDDGNGPLPNQVFAWPTLDAVLRAARMRPGWTRDMDDAFSDAMVAAGGRWPSFDDVWVRAEDVLAVFGDRERRITRAHARPLYHAVVAGGLDVVYEKDRFLESGWALQRDRVVDDFFYDVAAAAGRVPSVASALALGIFPRRAAAWAVKNAAKGVQYHTKVISILKYVHCAAPQRQVGSYCVTRVSPLQLLFLVSVATTHSYDAHVSRAAVPAADSFASAFDAVVGEEGAWTSVAPMAPPLAAGQRAVVGYPLPPALRDLMTDKLSDLKAAKRGSKMGDERRDVSARELHCALRSTDGDPLFELEMTTGVPVTVGHLLPFCRKRQLNEFEANENREEADEFLLVYAKSRPTLGIQAGQLTDLGKRFEDAFAAATGADVLEVTPRRRRAPFAVLHGLPATANDVPTELIVPFFSADLGHVQPVGRGLIAGLVIEAGRTFKRQHRDQVGHVDKRKATETGPPAKKQKPPPKK